MTQDIMVVSEEQAAALEKAGIKVEMQYVVKIADLRPAPAPEPAQHKTIIRPTRSVKFGHLTKLRWTDLKWTGKDGSQPHMCYKILHEYFHSRAATGRVLTREAINRLLATELAQAKTPFNSSFVSYLCEQKYLEPVA
jgi:hypothetical protein